VVDGLAAYEGCRIPAGASVRNYACFEATQALINRDTRTRFEERFMLLDAVRTGLVWSDLPLSGGY
jgi:hypothetical protein